MEREWNWRGTEERSRAARRRNAGEKCRLEMNTVPRDGIRWNQPLNGTESVGPLDIFICTLFRVGFTVFKLYATGNFAAVFGHWNCRWLMFLFMLRCWFAIWQYGRSILVGVKLRWDRLLEFWSFLFGQRLFFLCELYMCVLYLEEELFVWLLYVSWCLGTRADNRFISEELIDRFNHFNWVHWCIDWLKRKIC